MPNGGSPFVYRVPQVVFTLPVCEDAKADNDRKVIQGKARLSLAQKKSSRTGSEPTQCPPRAWKTFVAANVIVELVRRGQAVGITANSHKVIRTLIDETIKVSD